MKSQFLFTLILTVFAVPQFAYSKCFIACVKIRKDGHVEVSPPKLGVEVKAKGFKVSVRGVPDPVTRLAQGIDHTIKRNAATLGVAGRVAACYYTHYCSSELYISRRKDEAIKAARQALAQYTAAELEKARTSGAADLEEEKRNKLTAAQQLIQVLQEQQVDGAKFLQGQVAIQAAVQAELGLRSAYAARGESVPAGDSSLLPIVHALNAGQPVEALIAEDAKRLGLHEEEVVDQVLRVFDKKSLNQLLITVSATIRTEQERTGNFAAELAESRAKESVLIQEISNIEAAKAAAIAAEAAAKTPPPPPPAPSQAYLERLQDLRLRNSGRMN